MLLLRLPVIVSATHARAYKLDIKIVRLFNPYGPYQQLNKIIPTFYFQAKVNSPITVYGDGRDFYERDLLYLLAKK
jgi:dTDP-glucose 4,6-dehydratase